MKKTTNNNKFLNVMVILCCLFLLLIFIELVIIRNNIYDIFYAEDVLFQIEDSKIPSYRITFKLISNQNKDYEDKSLLVKFKCYDSNSVLIADDVEAKIEKGDFDSGMISYVSSARSGYNEITYCELNYVKELNN